MTTMLIAAIPLFLLWRTERRMTTVRRVSPLTPALMMIASLLFVYGIPTAAAFLGYRSPLFRPGRLFPDDLNRLADALLLGCIGIALGAVVCGSALRRRRTVAGPIRRISSSSTDLMAAATVAVWFIHLGVGTGLNPRLMIARMLQPRDFTALRSGAGFFVYLRAAAFTATLVAIAVDHVQSGRSMARRNLYWAIAVLSVLGGSKTSIVVAPVVWIATTSTVRHRQDQLLGATKPRGIPTAAKLRVGLALVATLILSFGVMRSSALDVAGISVGEHVIAYQREAYYSARVIRDFDSDVNRGWTLVSDAARGAVPRTLVGSKGAVGFYGRYWRHLYEPNVVDYHVSTFGYIAEAHMVLGRPGVLLWGSALGAYCILLAHLLTRAKSAASLAVTIFGLQWTYFMVRAGFGASSLLYVIVVVVGMRLWFAFFERIGTRSHEAKPAEHSLSDKTPSTP